MTCLIRDVALVFLAIVPVVFADTPSVPRYKFEPGQELTYRTTSTLKYGEGKVARERGSRTDWTVWVVRRNDDGSFRLVIRQQDSTFHLDNGEKRERPALSRLV